MFLNFIHTVAWLALSTTLTVSIAFAVYQHDRYENTSNKSYHIIEADVQGYLDSLARDEQELRLSAQTTFTPEVIRQALLLKEAEAIKKSHTATATPRKVKKDTLIEPNKIVPPPLKLEPRRVKWRQGKDTSWHFK